MIQQAINQILGIAAAGKKVGELYSQKEPKEPKQEGGQALKPIAQLSNPMLNPSLYSTQSTQYADASLQRGQSVINNKAQQKKQFSNRLQNARRGKGRV